MTNTTLKITLQHFFDTSFSSNEHHHCAVPSLYSVGTQSLQQLLISNHLRLTIIHLPHFNH
jgi:hypothetical protein